MYWFIFALGVALLGGCAYFAYSGFPLEMARTEYEKAYNLKRKNNGCFFEGLLFIFMGLVVLLAVKAYPINDGTFRLLTLFILLALLIFLIVSYLCCFFEKTSFKFLNYIVFGLLSVGLFFLASAADYNKNVIVIEEPKVIVAEYEFSSENNKKTPYNVFYIPESGGIYKVLYTIYDGDETRVASIKMPEDKTELIISDRTLIEETTTAYYSEDHNKEPYEEIVRETEKTYRFFITMEEFDKID